MKTAIFRLNNSSPSPEPKKSYEVRNLIFKIPILPAYAVVDSSLELAGNTYGDGSYEPPSYELKNDTLVTPERHGLVIQAKAILTIYHNGIKNYRLLFPHVKNELLKARLGDFAQEVEKAFDSGAWVSYCIMVGSVVEGLLKNEFNEKTFFDLIEKAKTDGYISHDESVVMHQIRDTRNLVHAGKYEDPICNRETALEMSVVYDKLIKRDWSRGEN